MTNKTIKDGVDYMRKKQNSLMDEFNISSEQFDEIIKLYGERDFLSKEDRSPELLRKDITKGYIKDNVVLVSKVFSDIIDRVRMELN